MQEETIEVGEGATLRVFSEAIEYTPEEVDQVAAIAKTNERLRFKLYGKECIMRRRQIMFGKRSYKFSRIEVPCHQGESPPLIQKCTAFAKTLYPDMDANAALANHYEKDDYISAHRDKEAAHKPGVPIIGFSFGETRNLIIKRYKRKRGEDGYTKLVVELPAGSVYVMEGPRFQQDFTHEIGKGKVGERLSVTVREFI